MTINIKPLLDQAETLNLSNQSLVNAARSTSGVGLVTNKSTNIVKDFSQLPEAGRNVGRMFYVQSNNSWVYSNGLEWSANNSTVALYTWGNNNYGQNGTNDAVATSSPGTTAGGGSNWSFVSAGYLSIFGIKTDGTLWAWGYNSNGQLGNSTTTSRSSPSPLSGNNWRYVDSGTYTTGAIKTDGSLWMWGRNTHGQVGDLSIFDRSSPVQVSGLGTNWKMVSVGYKTTVATKTDGTLWTWGANYGGDLGTNNTTSRSSPGTTVGGGTNWLQASTSKYNSAAVKSDGTLWTWGINAHGQLGTGDTTSRSSPGTTAGGGTDWKYVSVGYQHMVGLKVNGTLWTWGRNIYGNLGTGNTTSRSSPGTTAGGGTNWSSVKTGYGGTVFAIKTNGTLWTWGSNTLGDLGDNSVFARSSPGTVAGGGTNWIQASTGGRTNVALTLNRK